MNSAVAYQIYPYRVSTYMNHRLRSGTLPLIHYQGIDKHGNSGKDIYETPRTQWTIRLYLRSLPDGLRHGLTRSDDHHITMAFNSIPILDLSLARNPDTKPAFLQSLQHTLLEVGFLYIRNTGIPDALVNDVIREGIGFFDLPEEKKLEVQMKNAPSFLGSSSSP